MEWKVEMRKLKLQVQITVDGFVGGPNGELDWMTWNWDDKLKDHVTKLTEPVDCVLLGRKMTDGFISHWAKVAEDPSAEDYWAGRKFTANPKGGFHQNARSIKMARHRARQRRHR